MRQNVGPMEYGLRVAVATFAGVAAALAPASASRLLLLGVATGLLATAATGYCPVNAVLEHSEEEPRWRTLTTFRVEP